MDRRASLFVGPEKSRWHCTASAGWGGPINALTMMRADFDDEETLDIPLRRGDCYSFGPTPTHGLPFWPNHSGHRSLRRSSPSSTQLNATMNSEIKNC
jgi:hypothetical protein